MQIHAEHYLDCSHEVTAVPTNPRSTRAWMGNEIFRDDWLFTIPDPALDEIHRLAQMIASRSSESMPGTSVLGDEVHIPHCRQLFARIKSNLDSGVGFAVADHLPVGDYPAHVLAEVFWLLGQLIGQPVAQKHNGQMIYDVRNTGQPFAYGVRGSTTSIELNFHTDNAFGKALPEYVGLFCRHPAREGGISRFCSLYALHDKIGQSHPAALQRLYQPMFYDRQKEHQSDAPKVTLAPWFSWHTDSNGQPRLRARANSSLVRKGYDVAGIRMEPELEMALEVVDNISKEPQFWYEAALEKGQIQYLNNRETGHYRSEFVDFEESDKKRHLYRLWHRNEGDPSYHGDAH